VLALVVIFVGVMPTGLFLYAHRKAELAQMSAMFERDMRALVEASRSSGVAKELPEGEVRGGDLGKIEKLLRDYINQAIRAGNEYQETFEHSGFNRILDPQRLAQDSTLAESRTILKRVRETMSTFQQQLDGLPESLRKDAERLDVSPRFKREFLAGYQRGLEEGNTRSVKLVALQREALGEYEQIIDLLEQTKGSWMIRDGHIEFASEATLSLINAHVDAIGKIEERQTALQSEMFDKLETNIQNLRR
jgi:hypothetical protein